jgi:hypothetical protein
VYFVENLNPYNGVLPFEEPAFAGSSAMISQWRPLSNQCRWETHSYYLSGEKLTGAYIDSASIAAGTIRRTMRCAVEVKDNGRIICK